MALIELETLLGVDGLALELDGVLDELRALLAARGSPAATRALHVVKVSGKGIRPGLTIAASRLGAADVGRVVNAAVAVELIQVGSLVHDDIIDESATRRGLPTLNSTDGDAIALRVGDYILARAAQAAATAGDAIAVEVSRAIRHLCVGQALEMQQVFDAGRTIDAHLESVRKKTAALFSCACKIGGLCAGLDDEALDALATFGDRFGMAFQLVDDVLDLVSSRELLGKPVNNDIASGVYTLPVLLALEGSHSARVRELLVQQRSADARLEVLCAGTIEPALDAAAEFAVEAVRALTIDGAERLRGFPIRYVNWALDQYVDGSVDEGVTAGLAERLASGVRAWSL